MRNHRKTKSIPKPTVEWRSLHPTTYEDFTTGDVVKVRGTTSSRWVFQYANLRRDGSLDSITVLGGKTWGSNNTKEFRSFTIDRVSRDRKALHTTPRKNGRKVVDRARESE